MLSHITFIADEESKRILDKYRTEIQSQNRSKDILMDYTENWGLPGFKNHLLMTTHPEKNKSFFFTTSCYLIFSFLLLNSLYRLLFDMWCGTEEYQFLKELSVRPFPSGIAEITPSAWMNSHYSNHEGGLYETSYKESQKSIIESHPMHRTVVH